MRVLVVGAGPVGLVTALELAGRGAAVTVVAPSGGAAAAGAGWAAGGMLSPVHEFLLPGGDRRLLAPGLAAGAAWTGLAARTGITLSGPATFVAHEDGEARELAAGAAAAAADGIELDETTGPAGMRRLTAWRCKTDRSLSPRQGLARLAAAAGQAGVRRICGAVTVVEPAAVTLAGGDRIVADRIVLASGHAGLSGVAGRVTASLVPVGGQLLRLPARVTLDGPVRWGRHYLVPHGDSIALGATAWPGRVARRPCASAARQLQAVAGGLFGGLSDALPLESWTGTRPGTPDGLPLLGPLPQAPGVIAALGAYRNGWLLAPWIAQVVADAATGIGLPDPAFRPERFAAQAAPASVPPAASRS